MPESSDEIPLIGAIPGYPEVYIGCGHSCWGILLGPATGEALAALIDKATPLIDMKKYNPNRIINP